MKGLWKKPAACLLLCSLLLILAGCAGGGNSGIDSEIAQTAKSLQSSFGEKQPLGEEDILPAGDSGSDWTAMALAFSGRKDAYDDYLERLEQYVIQKYDEQGSLSEVKATEYHRIALTMLALGGDPADIESREGTIDLIADGTWNFPGGSPGLQGSNGLIYALLVLDAADAASEPDAGDVRQEILEELLACQDEDGSFWLDRSMGGDTDITAMAVQALAPYMDNGGAAASVEKALDWLSGKMTENAGFSCYGQENAESSAQVILALCALGIDPEQEERFQRDGKTLLDGMDRFRVKSGMYRHTLEDDEENTMATYQCLLALEAVNRLREKGTWIFDFTDYTPPESS